MTDNEIDPKMLALAKHLDVDVSTVSECRGMGDDVYESVEEPGEYRVLTDEEADTAQRDYWTNYPDDTGMFRNWPEDAVDYFDKERWVEAQIVAEDASGGRGNTLAGYNGQEHEIKVGDAYYYVYRVG